MPEPLDEQQLVSILKQEWDTARDYYDSEVADAQAACIKAYEGETLGNEVEGRSQVVLPDVKEAVDYMTISVLRAFVSGDDVVEFEGRDAESAQLLDEATQAVSRQFMQGQDGYRILHDVLKAGLIEKIGVAKSALTMQRTVRVERFAVDADGLAMLDESMAVNATDNGDGSFDVTVREPVNSPRVVDYTVPSEEFRISPRARSEDEADYIAHACMKTRSELVEMGFDADTVYELPKGDEGLWTDSRKLERDRYSIDHEAAHASMEEVLLVEEYIRVDADGDGVAELLQVFRVADTLLSVTEADEQPFTVFCPFPLPHRLVGESLADRVIDIQAIRSIVARQMLDAMYSFNEPRFWVPQESTVDGVTMDDLLRGIGPVRGKGAPPQMLGGNFDISKSMAAMDFFTAERESRTGITRLNQGLDADALNKTATGTALLQAQGQQYEEFVARNFANWLGRLFLKRMKLLRRAGPFQLKLDGEYRDVDPSQWPEEADVMVRTGLGTGRKEARLQMRMTVLEMQREALPMGLCDGEKLFKNAAAIVKDAGLGQPDDYFVNPANIQPGQEPKQQPDPEMAKVQAQMQLNAAKLDGEQQLAQQRMDLARTEAEAQARLARDKAALEAELARDKAAAEMQLAEDRMAFEQRLAMHRQSVELSKPREGGSLAA